MPPPCPFQSGCLCRGDGTCVCRVEPALTGRQWVMPQPGAQGHTLSVSPRFRVPCSSKHRVKCLCLQLGWGGRGQGSGLGGWGRGVGWVGPSQGTKLACGCSCPPPSPHGQEPTVAAARAPCMAPPVPCCSYLPSQLVSGRVRAAADCELGSLGVASCPSLDRVCPVLLPCHVPPPGPDGTTQRCWGTGCWTEPSFLPCQVPV